MFLETRRIKLVNGDQSLLKSILLGEDQLSEYLQVEIAATWSTFGLDVFQYSLDKITEHPASTQWWTYLMILKEAPILIGNCGYKGMPDVNGMVEIGYEIAEKYQNRGLATEAAQGLVKHAFQAPSVQKVQAHTLAGKNPSVRVLEKCNFKFIKEINDPEDGLIWQWAILRDQHQSD